MGQLWIVMPVYFDIASFSVMKEEILKLHPQAKFVILDDSAGADPEMNSLRKESNIWVIEPPFNLGHQRGIVYALRLLSKEVAPEDTIITMDSDGEDRVVDIPDLLAELENLEKPKHTIALVQRTKRKESPLFKAFYIVYKMAFRWLTGTIIRSGNFASFKGEFLTSYISHPNFDLCYSSTLVNLKAEKRIIQRPRGTRIQGRSKMNFMSLIMHGIRMLMPFMDQIAIRSLIAFAGLFSMSLLLAFVVVGVKVLTNEAIPGWATYTLMMSFLMSFVALGNFLVLFSIFSQSQGLAMSRLEELSQPQRKDQTATLRKIS